jgi:cytochrome c-type biogenesis protein
VNAQIGIGAAFLAGLVSFLSPCVLPMVPGYVSFLTGAPSTGAAPDRRRASLVGASLLFVAGFTAVFVALGSTASVAGMALGAYRPLLSRAAGLLIIAFGVVMLGVVRLPGLYREVRFDLSRARGHGWWTAPALGAAFAFGWTPCVGPVLGSILLLAGSGASLGTGALLLVSYSLGLGVPFVVFALFLARLTPLLHWLERHAGAVSKVGGAVLVAFGALLLTGTLPYVTALLARVVPFTGG